MLEQLIKDVLDEDGKLEQLSITPKNGKLEQLSLVEISPMVVGAIRELVASNEMRVAGQRGMSFILHVIKEWLQGLNFT